jgi:hypothetical protein
MSIAASLIQPYPIHKNSMQRPKPRRKPHTPIRRWHILRATGLEILNILLHKVRPQYGSESEEKKVVVDVSFWIALERCGVHLLPIGASIAMMYLNFAGYYIGSELAGLPGYTSIDMALLQLASKFQELLIIASLATVIFHRVRYELLWGKGLPLGLLGSGFSFAQASFFWSPDFVGAMKSGNWKLHILLIASGIIAATVGPSSAVLMIPRTVVWPAGGSSFYLNGLEDDFWPNQLSLDHYLPLTVTTDNETVDCTSSSGWQSALCPSGGYSSLANHYAANFIWDYPRMAQTFSFSTKAGTLDDLSVSSFAGVGLTVESPHGQIPPQTLQGGILGWSSRETSTYATHGATDMLQYMLNWRWYYAAMHKNGKSQQARYRYYQAQLSEVYTQIPAVRVVCSDGQNLTRGENNVRFPVLPEYDFATNYNYDGVIGEISLSINSLSNQTASDKIKVTFVPPCDACGAVTTGLLFETPWVNETTRLVTGCNVDARWAQAGVWAQYPNALQSTILHQRQQSGLKHAVESFLPVNDSSWRRIYVDDEWLEAVNFPIVASAPSYEGANISSLENLLVLAGVDGKNLSDFSADRGNPNSLAFLEHITATVFADAISRAGSFRSYDRTGPVADWQVQLYNLTDDWLDNILNGDDALTLPVIPENNYTTMRMNQTITGYGYKARTATDYLALSVILGHMAIALAHIVWVLCTRATSGCWDTITELLVLAQNSQPAWNALENTCAGIKHLHTFAQRSRVRVSNDMEEHLELVFDEDDGARNAKKMILGDKYGGLTGRFSSIN